MPFELLHARIIEKITRKVEINKVKNLSTFIFWNVGLIFIMLCIQGIRSNGMSFSKWIWHLFRPCLFLKKFIFHLSMFQRVKFAYSELRPNLPTLGRSICRSILQDQILSQLQFIRRDAFVSVSRTNQLKRKMISAYRYVRY